MPDIVTGLFLVWLGGAVVGFIFGQVWERAHHV